MSDLDPQDVAETLDEEDCRDLIPEQFIEPEDWDRGAGAADAEDETSGSDENDIAQEREDELPAEQAAMHVERGNCRRVAASASSSSTRRRGPPTRTVDAARTIPRLLGLRDSRRQLDNRIAAALKHGAIVVGVAGGDGSVSCAAQHLRGTDIALLVVPAGTRNHFAHDVGVDDLDDAAPRGPSARPRANGLGRSKRTGLRQQRQHRQLRATRAETGAV